MKKIHWSFPEIDLAMRSISGVILCFFMHLHMPVHADEKNNLRIESIRIAEQYSNDEISEKTAIERLDEITKRAQALRENSTVVSTKVEPELSRVGDLAGSMVLRKAVLPSLSLWNIAWIIFKPILWLSILILVILGIAIGIFGIRRMEIWSNVLRTKIGNIRNTYYSNRIRTRMQYPHPSNISTPTMHHRPQSRDIAGYPAPGTRHSGEVPDHLT